MHSWVVVTAKAGREVPPEVVRALDDGAPVDLTFPPSAHHRWASPSGHVHAAGWSVAAVNLGRGAYWEERPDGVTAFSGLLWVDAEPWRPDSSWAAQLADRYATVAIEHDVERFDGVFTLLHLDATGAGWITADPLGAGLVYRAETADVVIFGSRAALVAAVSTAAGRTPDRDLEAMALLGYTGTLQGDRTGFEGVRVLPQASIVRLRPGRDPIVERWATLPWWSDVGREAADDLIERSIARMRAKVRLAAELPARFTWAELTGGKDSRLVLALALAEGVEHRLRFQSWGGQATPDVQVARSLAERYDLTLISGGGYAVPGRGPHEPRTGLVEEPVRWEVRTLDVREQFEHHVWSYSGAVSIWDLKPLPWPPSTTLSVSGLFGEILRTNYSRTNGLGSADLLGPFLAAGGFRFDGAGLLTSDAEAHVRGVVEGQILDLMPPSGDVLDAIDGFYQQGRLRRWGGGINEVSQRTRAYPLYDLAAVRAAFAVGSDARRAEVVPFQILHRCAPELARLPFDDGGGWSAVALEGLTDAAAHPVAKAGSRWDAEAIVDAAARWSSDADLVRKKGRLGVALPRRRPMPTTSEQRRMDGFDEKREVLRSFLDLPPSHRLWDLFDRRRTHRALDRIGELTTRGRGQVHDAVTIAMWLDHRERKVETLVPTDG